MSLTIFSDGGGIKENTAAGACIVENSSGQRANLIVFLGGATNNEAEISAGLLGFAFVRAAMLSADALRWVADSEYALKSATAYIFGWQKNGWKTAAKKPVKNQGLWRSYLALSRGIKVIPEHVRGHTGHTENEAVDSASTWAQLHASEVLADSPVGSWVTLDDDSGRWYLLDGRPFIAALRSEDTLQPAESDLMFLRDRLVDQKVTSFDAFTSTSKKTSTAPRPAGGLPESVFVALREAEKHARDLGSTHEKGAAVAASIARILKKYQT